MLKWILEEKQKVMCSWVKNAKEEEKGGERVWVYRGSRRQKIGKDRR